MSGALLQGGRAGDVGDNDDDEGGGAYAGGMGAVNLGPVTDIYVAVE